MDATYPVITAIKFDSHDLDMNLNIVQGVYINTESECSDASNAGFRVWNGQGLSGSQTYDCQFDVSSRKVNVFKGTQTCTNTYDDKESTVDLTVQKINDKSVRINGNPQMVYRLCPPGTYADAFNQHPDLR